MSGFLDSKTHNALMGAVQEIETHSSAEVVVAIRPKSGNYLHIDLVVGIAVGTIVLAVLLFGPWLVATPYFLVDPLVIGMLATWASGIFPSLHRLLSRQTTLIKNVDHAASEVFVQRGVHNTRKRTGVLIYISLLEKTCTIVADSGIELAVSREAWSSLCDELRDAVQNNTQANAMIDALTPMGELLALHLPREEDDLNELQDEVVV